MDHKDQIKRHAQLFALLHQENLCTKQSERKVRKPSAQTEAEVMQRILERARASWRDAPRDS